MVPADGPPLLYEVIGVEDDERIRIHIVDWPPDYVTVVRVQQIRHVAAILVAELRHGLTAKVK